MSSFEKGFRFYERYSQNNVVGPIAFSNYGSDYIEAINQEIRKLATDINGYQGNGKSINFLKGDIAENWHGNTINIDAKVNENSNAAVVPRSNELASPDVILGDNRLASLKYYRNGEESAKAQAISIFQRYKQSGTNIPFEEYLRKNGISEEDVIASDPLYTNQLRVIPADQLEKAIKYLKLKIEKERIIRPEQVKRYEQTLNNLTDRLKDNQGNESIPLTENEAKEIAEKAKRGQFDPSEYDVNTESLVKFEHILKQGWKTGKSAVELQFILSISVESIKCIHYLLNEEGLSFEDIKKSGLSVFSKTSQSFLRGFITGSLVTACCAGKCGDLPKHLSNGLLASFVVITFNMIDYSYKVSKGEMTKAEMANNMIRDAFVIVGALTGKAIIAAITKETFISGIIGSMIGSVVGQFAYDTSYDATISFCVESGCTFFGLVDQNYELPKEVLQEIGIELFEFERFEPEYFEFDRFEFERFEYEQIELCIIETTFLRRGVIGINMIGYV